MEFFADDCVMVMPTCRRLEGKQQVREGIQSPSGRSAARSGRVGEPIEVRGCDLFAFADGKITRKDSYW